MASPLTKLWEHPDIPNTNIEIFRHLANKRHSLNLRNYHDLWTWSTEDLNSFWMLIWEFTNVNASVHPSYAIQAEQAKGFTPPPAWFPQARLNFAQNILESSLCHPAQADVAILTGIREGGHEVEQVSLPQLRRRVGLLANSLTRAGVRKLDRVACIGSNSVDTFVLFLAAAAIGAIFTSCSPDMGEKAILDRFLQVKPKVLFADDWIVYNSKQTSCAEKAQRVACHLRSQAGLQDLVIFPRFPDKRGGSVRANFHTLESFTAEASGDIQYQQLEFSHPLVIVYSSGTTGPPKCLVHTAGGILIKQKVEQILCMDMNPDSVFMQYTTTSWIMYLYAVSGLLSGARSILYDGSPMTPTPRKFLDVLAKQGITHFGTSAHYLALLEQAGLTHEDVLGLGKLKAITSTGSVLTEAQYYWVYNTFGAIQLSSIAGGTDIAGAFVGGTPNLPVYAGWCQARTLGMKVQIYSDNGESIEASGQAGELVCTTPFPSQPIMFWGDQDGTRYKSAYFEKFPGVWAQGDYIRMEPNTQCIQFLGRSDGVLNPSGVRFGSAEIYQALNELVEIEDSLCIGQRRPHDRDERVLLFLKMKQGHAFSDGLKTAIESRIRKSLSPRHVPKFIFPTPEIPMTVNGKKTELLVKKIVSGQKVIASSTITNPHALKWYEQFINLDSNSSNNPPSKL
ncbi:hypothetical protein FE257_001699 [Aspergillus nanangensis]|uniref:AMP-dependent synthetase/ligase domain-containing protein n=1 Tax=Aspergillus nanangensis TaxID=2582783 RepID=A0AAD4CDM7_ASPNN|nr:hypothetical protein FE257_001699 [Aspergillus nanangensis]